VNAIEGGCALKKTKIVVLILIVALFLVACRKTKKESDQDRFNRVYNMLEIGYQELDNSTSVTQNIQLRTIIESVQITWQTSDPSAISNRGIVARKIDDIEVTLTALLSYKGISDSKVFVLMVRANSTRSDVDQAKAELDIIFSAGDSINHVTKDIVLRTKISDVSIEWTSSHPSVISPTGTVTQQKELVKVTLNSLIHKNGYQLEKTFILTVIAKEETDEEKVNVVFDKLEIIFFEDDSLASVQNDLVLTAAINGVSITWSSSNLSVITNDGLVFQQKEDAQITLTASLTLGAVTKTKIFNVTVIRSDKLYYEDFILQRLDENLIELNEGETLETIKHSLVLKEQTEEIALSWQSSRADILSNEGVVYQYIVDTALKLTVTGSYLDYTASKTFDLIVLSNIVTVESILTKPDGETVVVYLMLAEVSQDGLIAYGQDETGFMQIRAAESNLLFKDQAVYVRGILNRDDVQGWIEIEEYWEDEQGSNLTPKPVEEVKLEDLDKWIQITGSMTVEMVIINELYQVMLDENIFFIMIEDALSQALIDQIVEQIDLIDDSYTTTITSYIFLSDERLCLRIINVEQIELELLSE